jgi:multidrug resistance efflux pump
MAVPAVLIARCANARRALDLSQSSQEPPERQRQPQSKVRAAQLNAKFALDSQINGENAQIRAQLDNARWDLAQTTIRAPADGYVTVAALSVGDRALQDRSVISFVVTDQITIVGMFSPNGFQTFKTGALVIVVFDNNPGRLYHAKITEISRGVGQGQIGVSGMLAKVGAIGGAKEFPAAVSLPDGADPDLLRLGMLGTATVFSGKAGVIGLLAWILIWISSYTAYL